MTRADELDFSLLPTELRHLATLIVSYAESDDTARADLLASAPADELRDLGNAVLLHWNAINAFLDENSRPGGPRHGLAVALDDFLQAGTDAQVELKARHARQAGKGKKARGLTVLRSGSRRAVSAVS